MGPLYQTGIVRRQSIRIVRARPHFVCHRRGTSPAWDPWRRENAPIHRCQSANVLFARIRRTITLRVAGWSIGVTHKRSGRRRPLFVLVSQLPVVMAGVGVLFALLIGRIDFWPAVLVFAACLVASFLLAHWSMHHLTCEACDSRMTPPRGWWWRFSGQPIWMHCKHCDVDWDIGLRGNED